jgi:CRISPR-associated endoribonuclease Cas6
MLLASVALVTLAGHDCFRNAHPNRRRFSVDINSIAPPSRLYALLLRLRPLEAGTLMPFSGELVHAAWLEWVKAAAPDVASMLHDGNRRRLFTCSSLLFPVSRQRALQAERENTHMPLNPEKTYSVRLTLLLGELFPLFYSSLMFFNNAGRGAMKQPFMRLGKQAFLLDEVISSPDDTSGWTGFTSFASLADKARALRLSKSQLLTLEFDALTTFNRLRPRGSSDDEPGSTYGSHFARLPLPEYVFPGLAKRWQELAPPELAGVVQKERIERYIEDEGIVIEDYDLKAHQVQFVHHPQRGFVGTCCYELRGPDEETTAEIPLTVRQQLILLAQFAFYCGVGSKSPMGMGRVRLV